MFKWTDTSPKCRGNYWLPEALERTRYRIGLRRPGYPDEAEGYSRLIYNVNRLMYCRNAR